ncbi:MAG TPA: prolyl oligopeptidase family serine peptidase, partial [Gemmatimonadaceae bacterium]|nr:prolyl oligopeptidase family serine peptidase [Gemmatimonadaceae bacterium]
PAAEVQRLADLAWRSSPIGALDSWRSPVLLIHGDEDRNVRFAQTVDLSVRLQERGVDVEELVIPDDTHRWMRHANGTRVYQAAAEFLERRLGRAR